MPLLAPNIDTTGPFIKVSRSPLDYNSRRRYGNRLKRLHKVLGEIKPKNYNHSNLVTRLAAKPEPEQCGSVACAYGHAVVSGKFKGLLTKAVISKNAKPDENGFIYTGSIDYRLTSKVALREAIAKTGSQMYSFDSENDADVQADAYFGPGTWDSIFETNAYNKYSGYVTLFEVRKRIKLVAEKAYGIKF